MPRGGGSYGVKSRLTTKPACALKVSKKSADFDSRAAFKKKKCVNAQYPPRAANRRVSELGNFQI